MRALVRACECVGDSVERLPCSPFPFPQFYSARASWMVVCDIGQTLCGVGRIVRGGGSYWIFNHALLYLAPLLAESHRGMKGDRKRKRLERAPTYIELFSSLLFVCVCVYVCTRVMGFGIDLITVLPLSPSRSLLVPLMI